jgi:hypothetical protein
MDTSTFKASFTSARRVSTPLIAVRTADAASTVQVLVASLNGAAEKTPLVHWDIIRGLIGVNQRGESALTAILGPKGDPAMVSGRPTDALVLADKLPDDTVLFMANMQEFWPDAAVAQAVWNLRDGNKSGGRMVVLMTTVGAILPPILSKDVLVLDQPLPSVEDLAEIVKAEYATETKGGQPDDETLRHATDALIGLAAFPAEQCTAMSLDKRRKDAVLDLAGLWERKRSMIEQTPGLSVWRGGESFEDIGGCGNAKNFCQRVIKGKRAPRVIVFLDEIEKAFAGTGTDLSGVKTEMTGTMLTWMQDNEADGMIFIGPPGAAKSAMAKAVGNTARVPTIAFDLAAMQSSLVGASGERLRQALAIVQAVSQGKALFIATCNSIGSLPPELRRRFKLATFFFDLPTAEERDAIWVIYETKYGVSGQRPEDTDWTGAEIKQCCENADALGITLVESAAYVVPVARALGAKLTELRQSASDSYISAGAPGVYHYDEKSTARAGKPGQSAKRVFRSREGDPRMN